MIGYFGGAGVGRPETRAERRERHKQNARRIVVEAARLDDAGKTRVLAAGMVRAVQDRGAVDLGDLLRTGIAKGDIERLFSAAFEQARAIDAALMDLAGQDIAR